VGGGGTPQKKKGRKHKHNHCGLGRGVLVVGSRAIATGLGVEEVNNVGGQVGTVGERRAVCGRSVCDVGG